MPETLAEYILYPLNPFFLHPLSVLIVSLLAFSLVCCSGYRTPSALMQFMKSIARPFFSIYGFVALWLIVNIILARTQSFFEKSIVQSEFLTGRMDHANRDLLELIIDKDELIKQNMTKSKNNKLSPDFTKYLNEQIGIHDRGIKFNKQRIKNFIDQIDRIAPLIIDAGKQYWEHIFKLSFTIVNTIGLIGAIFLLRSKFLNFYKSISFGFIQKFKKRIFGARINHNLEE